MKPPPKPAPTPAVELFERPDHWAAWLSKHGESSPGVWLQLAKKGSGELSVTYGEALEVALCYGWIDGIKKTHSDKFWLQKFTRRTPTSVWSKVNKDKALELIEAGKMKPAGLQEVERAKSNGRWEAAYESASKASVPDDLQSALDGNAQAKSFFEALDRQNRYAILFRIQTVKKPETRAKKIVQFVQMLERNEKIYP
ncbi:MAG: hypothetical protein RL173_2489 [Fibrobacterota bacterium]|jgi:uncharacterized protein YdeI (YjbR/CyaY-like superfamily)